MRCETSYSRRSGNLIVFMFLGITTAPRLFRIDTFIQNSTVLAQNGKAIVTPSDVLPLLVWLLDRNTKEWGRPDGAYIYSADSATFEAVLKHKRLHGSIYTIAYR